MFDDSSTTPARRAPDPLSEVLHDLRIAGVAYGGCELTSPWGIAFPAHGGARFHFVAAGQSWLHTETRGWMLLHAGDMVVLPHSTGHVLADVVERPTRPIDELPQEAIDDFTYKLRVGSGGAQTLIFCGSVHFDVPPLHPLVELLPHVLLVSDATTHDTTLPLLLTLMADEVRAERIGAATVLARLADVVLARVIRAWAEAHGADATGWLAAIRDPQIGHALAAIHRHPGHPWSVALLAAVAYSSRSLFSARFTAVVGVSPARYLTQWRMHVASGWLRTERLTVAEVAARLGYQSEASFSRAFKRHVGVTPSALRSGDEGCR